ncbi:RbsD/FucU family protein [Acidisphaera sp. S103]|uniref:RbsD/FucU family protein n=1 Tax=Acidisphaera sp. S103 TaxID=1747223 RepID=UPI00131ABC16|nr:RbsD/FucU domain-containing protein [Acidisphaera sp. S103]
MLKNVDPVLNADILHALYSMGHGDEVAIVDAHYPAQNAAQSSTIGKLLTMDGADTARAMRAILSVFELDSFVPQPAERMMVDNEPETLPHVQREAQMEINLAVGRCLPMASVVRQEYYQRAKNSYAVIMTGETRGWGCFILRKGLVVTEDVPSLENQSNTTRYGS